MPHALITGASSGLGTEFARQLATQGYDLTLLARSQHRLDEIAAELRQTHGRTVTPLSTDLSTEQGRAAAQTRLADGGVDLLVNNAGTGLRSEEHTAELRSRLELVCR